MHELDNQKLVEPKYLEMESKYLEMESRYVELRNILRFLLGSINLWRWLGYGLLVLALFDVIEIFIPPKFMNPAWEFHTIEALVGRVPLSLIGLVLVFSGKFYDRGKRELTLLKFLSWLTLLLGILFILLIPLGIANTIRLNYINLSQINSQYNQQMSQLEQFQKQLSQAKPEEIEDNFKRQGRLLDGKSPQELKSQALSNLAQTKQKIKTTTQQTRSSQSLDLLKSSVKLNLGALIAGILYIGIWRLTSWVRMS